MTNMELLEVKPSRPGRFEEIPNEVILDNIFRHTSAKAVVAFSGVNRRFNALAADDKLWAHFVLRDHSIPTIPPILASRSDPLWPKQVYAGLIASKILIWGRLGYHQPSTTSNSTTRKEGFTAQLVELIPPEETTEDFIRDDFADGKLQDNGFSGARIWAQVVVGDDHTVARTTDGRVYVWGLLRPGDDLGFDGVHMRAVTCYEPARLHLPFVALDIISSDRRVCLIDADNLVWELLGRSQVARYVHPLLCAPYAPGNRQTANGQAEPHITQVAICDQRFMCFSTADGAVLLGDSHGQDRRSATTDNMTDGRRSPSGLMVQSTIKDYEVIQCHPLPTLAKINSDIDYDLESRIDERCASPKGEKSPERIRKLVAYRGRPVVLKANGEVWRYSRADGWTYPSLSSPDNRDISCTDYGLTVSGPGHINIGNRDREDAHVKATSYIASASGYQFTLALTDTGLVECFADIPDDEGSDDSEWWTPGAMGRFRQTPTQVAYGIAAGTEHATMLVLGDVYTGYVSGETRNGHEAHGNENEHGKAYKPIRLRGGAAEEDDDENEANGGQLPTHGQNEAEAHGSIDRNQAWVEHPIRPDHPSSSAPPRGATFRIGFAGRHAVRPPPVAGGDDGAQPRGDSGGASTGSGGDGDGGRSDAPGGDSKNNTQAVGNHPNPTGGLRGPAFRVGFAGRHAVARSASRPQTESVDQEHAGSSQLPTPEQASQSESRGQGNGIGNHVGPGGALFRIGFAGRGAARGRGGRQGEDEANGKPW